MSKPTVQIVKAPTPARGTDAWLKVVESYNLCIRLLDSRLTSIDISIAEHDVLMALLHKPGVTQQEVAKACFVAKSGVSMLLKSLYARGLVRRDSDQNDARIKRVYLSAKGEKIALKALKIQQEIVAIMAAPISDADLQSIAMSMAGVSTRLRAANEKSQLQSAPSAPA